MNYWWTSDYHFSHFNIIRYCKRPFETAEEMNEAIICKHNERVKPDDTVFLYVGANLWASNQTAKQGDGRLVPFLSLSFTILHFGYGAGYLKGLWDFVLLRRHLHNKVKDVSLTR